MNAEISLAKQILDHVGATYVITHRSMTNPLFSAKGGEKKSAKLVASTPTTHKVRRRQRRSSKWRALFADIPVGGSKDLPVPEGTKPPMWQPRVAGAAIAIFGKGRYTTQVQPNGDVRVTRK